MGNKFIKIKLWLKKYSVRIFLFLLITYITSFVSIIFDDFNIKLLNRSKNNVFKFLDILITILTIKISILSLIIGSIFFSLVYFYFKKIKINFSKLQIIKARYGKNGKYIDIANNLNNLIEDNRIKVVLSNSIAGDPIIGTVKEGIVEYKYNGKINNKRYVEKDIIELP